MKKVLLVLLVLGVVAIRVAGASPQLLDNSGLDSGFYHAENPDGSAISEVEIPDGWELGWYEWGVNGYYHRPECKPEDLRTVSGRGYKCFTTYSTHQLWLYQRVEAIPGAEYTFSTWVDVWSSSKDDYTRNTDGSYWVNVCIDPLGEDDPFAGGVICKYQFQGLNLYEAWHWMELSVSAIAEEDRITVFVLGEPQWRVVHNDIYIDEPRLRAVEGPPPSSDLEARVATLEAFMYAVKTAVAE